MTPTEAKAIIKNARLPMTAAEQAQFRQAVQVCTFGGGIVVRTYDHDANPETPEVPVPETYDNDSNPATPEVPVPPTPSFWNRLKFW